jgi:hypothetical protein
MMQSADLLAGKEGTADPTELVELIEDLAELDKGSSKTPCTCFYKKSMSKAFPKKPTGTPMSVFPRFFFVFSCFRVFLSDGSSKALQQTFCKKNRALQKNRQKIQNHFFSIFLSHFWAFLGEGSSKIPLKKISGKKSDPGPFLASDPPTHHGGH